MEMRSTMMRTKRTTTTATPLPEPALVPPAPNRTASPRCPSPPSRLSCPTTLRRTSWETPTNLHFLATSPLCQVFRSLLKPHLSIRPQESVVKPNITAGIDLWFLSLLRWTRSFTPSHLLTSPHRPDCRHPVWTTLVARLPSLHRLLHLLADTSPHVGICPRDRDTYLRGGTSLRCVTFRRRGT